MLCLGLVRAVSVVSAVLFLCCKASDAAAKPRDWAVLVSGETVASPGADAPVTLHQSIADAWQRLPQRAVIRAQQNVAAARDLAGSEFLPDAPTAAGTYVNDKVAGSNYNYITAQVDVSTPVWLPGEGTAMQNAAGAEGGALAAQAATAHLALAGDVLHLATNAASASNARRIAQRRLDTARALSADMAHRFAVGESSQSDALAAAAEAANASVSLAQAELQLAAAKLALAALTGSGSIPMLAAPGGRMPIAASTEHPQLVAAAREVDAARAQARLVDIQDRDDPELGFEGINEKQPGTRWDTRFGVTLKFLFATEARNAPRRAQAEEAVTRAMVRLELTRRQVAAQIELARVTVAVSERAAAAAAQGAAAQDMRRGQVERAWRLGEMPLIELVRANALAFDAEAARDRTRIDRIGAELQLEIASGTIP